MKHRYDIENGMIYRITNKTNSKIYIGQTSGLITKRWKDHINGVGGNTYLKSDIDKYGLTAFTFEVLHEGIKSMEDLSILEKNEIEKHNSYNNGYNNDVGGVLKWKDHPIRSSTDYIIDLYVKHQNSASQISEKLGCNKSIIYIILQENNVEMRTPRDPRRRRGVRKNTIKSSKLQLSFDL